MYRQIWRNGSNVDRYGEMVQMYIQIWWNGSNLGLENGNIKMVSEILSFKTKQIHTFLILHLFDLRHLLSYKQNYS